MVQTLVIAICALVFSLVGVVLGVVVTAFYFSSDSDCDCPNNQLGRMGTGLEDPTHPGGWDPALLNEEEEEDIVFVDKFMVGKETGLVYSSIPEAVDGIEADHPVSVLIRHGTYTEAFTLPEGVSLRGFGRESVVISGIVRVSGGCHSISGITFREPIVTHKDATCNIRECNLNGFVMGECNNLELSKTHITGTISTPTTIDAAVGGKLALVDCVMRATTINITANMRFTCLRLSNFDEEDSSVLNLSLPSYSRSGTSGVRLIGCQIPTIVCQTTGMWTPDSNLLIMSCNLNTLVIQGTGTNHGISIINCTIDKCMVEACNKVLASGSFLGSIHQSGGIIFGEAITCYESVIEKDASCGLSGSLGCVKLASSGVVALSNCELDDILIEGTGMYNIHACRTANLQILPSEHVFVDIQNSTINGFVHCCASMGVLRVGSSTIYGAILDSDQGLRSLQVSGGTNLDFDNVRLIGSTIITNSVHGELSYLFSTCSFKDQVSLVGGSNTELCRFDFLRCTFENQIEVDGSQLALGMQNCTLRGDVLLQELGPMFGMSHTDYRTITFGQHMRANDTVVYIDGCVGGSGTQNIMIRTAIPFSVFEINNSFIGDLVFAETVRGGGTFRLSGCRINGLISNHESSQATLVVSSCVLNKPYVVTNDMAVLSGNNNSTIGQESPFVGETTPQIHG